MMTAILSLFGGAWRWLIGHARLAIEYVLLAAVVMLACTVLYNRGNIAKLETSRAEMTGALNEAADTINQQTAANKDQDAAIAKLHDLRELDSQAINGLSKDLHKIGSNNTAIRTKIARLEASNAQAKALLDTAVPADVGCVFDDTPCAASDNADSGSDGKPK